MEALRTILVIESDQLIIEAFRKFMQREGYRMLEAGKDSQAFEQLSREKVDLLIVDIDTSAGLLRDLKSSVPHIPVVAISSSSSDTISQADLLFCKPLELRMIREGIKNLLRR